MLAALQSSSLWILPPGILDYLATRRKLKDKLHLIPDPPPYSAHLETLVSSLPSSGQQQEQTCNPDTWTGRGLDEASYTRIEAPHGALVTVSRGGRS